MIEQDLQERHRRSRQPRRILLASHLCLVRQGLRAVLVGDAGLRVVGLAETGPDAVAAAQRLAADVAVLDLRLPEIDGISATYRVRTLAPRTKVIVLAEEEHPYSLLEAFKAGASGYLCTDVTGPELVAAVRTVADGGSVLNQELIGSLLRTLAPRGSTVSCDLAS